jgi:RanBP-type and C3HC4-type zinc finger-containing protein 1
LQLKFWFYKILGKKLVGAKLYEKHLERSMRLAEKAMANTFHCQTADCPGWAVVEADNVNVFRCPVCRQSNCLTCQAIHEGANCKEFQDRVNQRAETDDDARRTKEMIEVLNLKIFV